MYTLPTACGSPTATRRSALFGGSARSLGKSLTVAATGIADGFTHELLIASRSVQPSVTVTTASPGWYSARPPSAGDGACSTGNPDAWLNSTSGHISRPLAGSITARAAGNSATCTSSSSTGSATGSRSTAATAQKSRLVSVGTGLHWSSSGAPGCFGSKIRMLITESQRSATWVHAVPGHACVGPPDGTMWIDGTGVLHAASATTTATARALTSRLLPRTT